MNTEERQLAEMLHRVTPEPPRRMTVEDVAFRLASEAGRARRPREPRARRGLSQGIWAGPRLGTGAGRCRVVVVAGASAGIATVVSSHSHATSPGDGTPLSSASVSTSATSPAPSQPSTGPTFPPQISPAGCGAPS